MYIKKSLECTLTDRKVDLIVETICWTLWRYGKQTQAHLVNGFHPGIVKWLPDILEKMVVSGIIKADVSLNAEWLYQMTYELTWTGMWLGFVFEARKGLKRK